MAKTLLETGESTTRQAVTMAAAVVIAVMRRAIFALVVVSSAASVADAQTTLRYQFKEGDKLPYVMEQTMKMTMSSMGMDFETKMDMNMEMSLNVVEFGKDGAANLPFKMSAARMSMKSPGVNVTVDSQDKNEPDNEVAKPFRQLVKALGAMEMTGTMLPTGEMKDVKGSEETLKALKKTPGAEAFGDVMGPGSLKTMISFDFPTEAVSKGKTWKNKSETKNPFGKATNDNTYSYEGTVEKNKATLEKITMKVDTKIDVDPNAKIKITIKSSKGSGHILFDNRTGRLIESTTQQTTEMQMRWPAGQEGAQTVQQTTTFRLKK